MMRAAFVAAIGAAVVSIAVPLHAQSSTVDALRALPHGTAIRLRLLDGPVIGARGALSDSVVWVVNPSDSVAVPLGLVTAIAVRAPATRTGRIAGGVAGGLLTGAAFGVYATIFCDRRFSPCGQHFISGFAVGGLLGGLTGSLVGGAIGRSRDEWRDYWKPGDRADAGLASVARGASSISERKPPVPVNFSASLSSGVGITSGAGPRRSGTPVSLAAGIRQGRRRLGVEVLRLDFGSESYSRSYSGPTSGSTIVEQVEERRPALAYGVVGRHPVLNEHLHAIWGIGRANYTRTEEVQSNALAGWGRPTGVYKSEESRRLVSFGLGGNIGVLQLEARYLMGVLTQTDRTGAWLLTAGLER